MPVEKHPLREGVRDNTNHYVTGRDGGRDIDLRKSAAEGMQLYGRLEDLRDGHLHFAPNLTANLDDADETVSTGSTRASIAFIERTASTHRPASAMNLYGSRLMSVRRSNLQAAALHRSSGASASRQTSAGSMHRCSTAAVIRRTARGIAPVEGLYFIGLPWLHTWGSGRFSGIARDADYVTQAILARLRERASSRDTVAA